ncbi:MAG TPA: glycosyltransferase family 2 protein [Allocoleopsis sp.]
MSQNHRKTIAIMMLNWNGGNDTVECLDSLSSLHYPKDKISIWVADNNSSDNSLELILDKIHIMKEQNWQSVNLLKFDHNYGSPGGFNRIYQQINQDVDVLIRLDNDVVLTPDCITKMIDTLYSDFNIGIVGVRSYLYHQHTIKCSGAWYINWSINHHFALLDLDTILDCDSIVGNCMAIRHEVVKKLAYFFDEKLFITNDDLDLCMRVHQLQYKVLFNPHAICYHKSGTSTSKVKNQVRYYAHRNGVLMHKYYAHPVWQKFTGYIIIFLRLIKAVIKGDRYKVYGYIDGFFNDAFFLDKLNQINFGD